MWLPWKRFRKQLDQWWTYHVNEVVWFQKHISPSFLSQLRAFYKAIFEKDGESSWPGPGQTSGLQLFLQPESRTRNPAGNTVCVLWLALRFLSRNNHRRVRLCLWPTAPSCRNWPGSHARPVHCAFFSIPWESWPASPDSLARYRLHVTWNNTISENAFVFSPEGKLLSQFGDKGDRVNQLLLPFYCAVDQHDNIIISDNMNYCVKVFDPVGNFLVKIGSGQDWGQRQFQCPYGVCIDPENNILVTDNQGSKVSMFSANGDPMGDIIKKMDGCSVSSKNLFICRCLWQIINACPYFPSTFENLTQNSFLLVFFSVVTIFAMHAPSFTDQCIVCCRVHVAWQWTLGENWSFPKQTLTTPTWRCTRWFTLRRTSDGHMLPDRSSVHWAWYEKKLDAKVFTWGADQPNDTAEVIMTWQIFGHVVFSFQSLSSSVIHFRFEPQTLPFFTSLPVVFEQTVYHERRDQRLL